MPIPADQREDWLQRLSGNPQDTITQVAGLVRDDLHNLGSGEVLRVGTRILNGTAGQSFVLALTRGNDLVETSDLAKQYIETGTIERPPPGAE